jgi:hypothetical protein
MGCCSSSLWQVSAGRWALVGTDHSITLSLKLVPTSSCRQAHAATALQARVGLPAGAGRTHTLSDGVVNCAVRGLWPA